MADIITLKDNITDETLYPQTSTSAVYDADGNPIKDLVGVYTTSPEFIAAFTDADDHVLLGIKTDGVVFIPSLDNVDLVSLKAKVDSWGDVSGRILLFDDLYGKSDSYLNSKDNPEWLQVSTDSNKKVLAGIRTNGSVYLNDIDSPSLDALKDELTKVNKSTGAVEYYGKRLVLNTIAKEKNYCDVSMLCQKTWTTDDNPMSITTNTLVDLQSSAVYNNYVFNFLDGGNCYIMKLDTNEYVNTVSTGLSQWHCNNAQFSNIFYSASDTYPLVLVSNGGELTSGGKGACAYIRIQQSGSTFSMSKVMEIQTTFDRSRHIGTFIADWYSNKLWLYCFDHNWEEHTQYNPIWFIEYPLPEFINGSTVVLGDDAILQTAKYPMYNPYLQGGLSFNGKLLIGTYSSRPASGLTNEEAAATDEDYADVGKMFFVLDQGDLSLETYVPISKPADHEIEGISLYNDAIYLTERSGGRTNEQHATDHTKQIYTLLKYDFK